jgi:glycosyltransferase involved in cell wall biosynthesis
VPPGQIPQLAGAMDILVHPSRREGLARALAQAQLAGHPVIAYDIDGNREGLVDGRTGYLIPPWDVGKLSSALEVLLDDGALRRRMGQAGREFAARRFGAEVMVDALDQVYSDALANPAT